MPDHHHRLPDRAMVVERSLDVAAANLLAAAAEGCQPCQLELTHVIVGIPSASAELVRAAFAPLLARVDARDDPFASEDLGLFTGRFAPASRRVLHGGLSPAHHLSETIAAMSDAERRLVIRDALDLMVGSGVLPPSHVPPAETLAPTDVADAVYHLHIGMLVAAGRQVPLICLEPDSPNAGLDDLRDRCGMRPYRWPRLPEIDADWRLTVDTQTRSLTRIVHIDGNDESDLTLWKAVTPHSVPDTWWDLTERIEYALILGPADGPPGSWITTASRTGKLAGVLARMSVR